MTQVPIDESSLAHEVTEDGVHRIASDLAYIRTAIVNVVFFGTGPDWVLIDAGIVGSRAAIASAAKVFSGCDAPPKAIIVTHGHFDHVGALESLAAEWSVPIYAHALEHPYLNGQAAYPDGDPSVGGGLMAALSRFYPTKPVDVARWLSALPEDRTVPFMPGWRWLHTPGHSPGHVSLFREADRTLIAGDAFVTTRQESAYAAMLQTPEIHGPPQYFTIDWLKAQASVERLAALNPRLVISGHGRAMEGLAMSAALETLAHNFAEIAVPCRGLYVDNPATAEDGSAYRW
jgi:glyoxylase-like metal-dependent hydrolase (beta-lactamase superfamily II)